ncbi:MAG: 2-amino-4-hydroxy-6-hydroxymethyldihydropteridine diphosphokinase [Chloroflexota bacterium]
MNKLVYIGLGSNMGDRLTHIEQAISDIKHRLKCEILAISSVYETSPVGVESQPDFLNCVCLVSSTLDAQKILKKLLEIEKSHGRVLSSNISPRTLDLDILLFGELTVNEPGLVIPHPRITERAFVLVPLAEIRPNLTHPSWTLTVTELLESLTYTDKVEKIPCSKPYLG